MKLLMSSVMATAVLLTTVNCAGTGATGGNIWFASQHYTGANYPTPITVYASRSMLDQHNKSFDMAIEEYPCNLFVRVERAEDAVIKVLVGNLDRPKERKAAATMVMGSGAHDYMILDGANFPWGDITGSYLVFLHELGHAAGLEHDPMASHGQSWVSVMAPNALDFIYRLTDFTGKLLPFLLPGDEEALKEVYCD